MIGFRPFSGGSDLELKKNGRSRARKRLGRDASPQSASASPGDIASSPGARKENSNALLAYPAETLATLFGEFLFLIDSRGIIRAIWTEKQTFRHRPTRSLLGRQLCRVIYGRRSAALQKILRRVWTTGVPEFLEYPAALPGGTRWFATRVLPVAYQPRDSKMLRFLSKDITDRKLVEENLRKSQTLLAESETLAHAGSWELNIRTGAIAWSDNLFRLYGYAPGEVEITEELALRLLHPDDRKHARNLLGQAVVSGGHFDHEYRCPTGDGRFRVFHTRFAPFLSDTGEPVRIVGSTQDITERKLAEEKIQKSEALLAQAEQIANMGSWEVDLETGRLTWSEQRYRMADMDPRMPAPSLEELWNLVHPDDREARRSDLEQAVAHKRPFDSVARFLRANGQSRLLHTRAVPIVETSGRVVRFVGMTQDITDRRSEEDRLRRSEALLDQAEQIAAFGCWERDLSTGRVILSKNLRKMYGLAPDDQWDIERYWNSVQRTDRDDLREKVEKSVLQGQSYEYITRVRTANGAVRTYHVRGVPVPGSDGSPALVRGVVHDITSQVRVEDDLSRLSQQLMRTQDTERRQIARDLHESAGQTLAALKMTLANLEDAIREDNEDALAHLSSARGLAEDAIREIRVLSYLMHPPMLDEAGLGPTLQWYGRGFSDRSNIATTVEVDPGIGRLPQDIETTVFRIVQEALTNVHRYSGSRTAFIRLSRGDGHLRVEIQDQGCGLHSVAPARNARLGVGIAGMRERVRQLNGIFEMESVAGHGTTVRAFLPLLLEGPQPESACPAPEDTVEYTKGD